MNFHQVGAFIIAVVMFCGCRASLSNTRPFGETRRGVLMKNLEEDDEGWGGDHSQEIFEAKGEQINQIKAQNSISGQLSNQTSPQFHEISQKRTPQYQQQQVHLPRLLQSNQTPQASSNFIRGCCLLLEWVLILTRNLLLLGLFTHSIEIFLPYLILSESFLMLGFWACQKHYLATLFAAVFASPWDLLNAVRLVAQPPSSPANLPQLAQYGFSSVAVCSLAGELLVAALLLTFTAVSKNTTLCTKYEWMRRLASNLRPTWNAYFMAVLPRVATLTGLHLRDFGHGAAMDAVNGITCALLFLALAVFFLLLFLQTRRTVGGQTEAERKQLGLVDRIDSRREFNFDCLECSSLYYPCMNYVRLVLYFIPIGLLWDCNELAYGGPIASQFLMVMIQTTSPAYALLKDRILFPLLNFLMIVVQLSLMTVGLAQSAPYSPLSESVEVVLLAFLLVLLGTSLTCTGVDCWREGKMRWNRQEERREHGKNETTHRFGHGVTRKTEESEIEEDKEKYTHEQKTGIPPASFKQTSIQPTKLKIKKARTVKTFGGF